MSIKLKRHNVEHRYFDAAVYNGITYVTGRVPKTTLDAGVVEQTAEVLAIIDRVLAANGSDKMCIPMCQIFLKDISEIGEMNKVWDQWAAADSKNSPSCAIAEAVLANPKYRIKVAATVAQRS